MLVHGFFRQYVFIGCQTKVFLMDYTVISSFSLASITASTFLMKSS